LASASVTLFAFCIVVFNFGVIVGFSDAVSRIVTSGS